MLDSDLAMRARGSAEKKAWLIDAERTVSLNSS